MRKQAVKAKALDSIGHLSYTLPMREQIITWRLRLKLTQLQLAEEVGVHVRTLRRYERGLHQPHALFATRLQEWLAQVRSAEHMVQEGLPPHSYRSSGIAPPVPPPLQDHFQEG